MLARRRDRLEAMKKELESAHGISVRIAVLDVRDRAAVDRFAQEHSSALDETTALINNAGLAKGLSPIDKGDVDHWEQMIDTNVKGLLYMTRAVLPHMRAKSRGHVVNIGSVAGFWTYPNGNVYSATKYAVRALTESMRLDLNGSGIRVSEISPGLVETEFSQVRLDDAAKAKAVYSGMTPLKAQDIAEAVLWCVDRPAHVNIQEIVLYPTDQASPRDVTRRP